ncbi:MAG: hypothetical protein V1703_04410 [Candidatus Altiarchaeota archaeon]
MKIEHSTVTDRMNEEKISRSGLHFDKKGLVVLGIILLLLVGGTYFGVIKPILISLQGEPLPEEEQPTQILSIPLNQLIELDFKTKAEVYQLRREAVVQHSQLIEKEYTPSDLVFGEIVDGRPWWGILGLSYYGNGEKGIEGESLQSLHITNPFLLVGLDEGYAHIVPDELNLTPQAIYPKPINLIWSADRTWARVTYNITELREIQMEYRFPNALTSELEFVAYNARDMGFNYLYIDTEKSSNINLFSKHSLLRFILWRNEPVQIKQFIHLGGSCGYPGGCNNISPHQSEFVFRYYHLPARIHLKLWRDKPDDTSQKPDMVYIIDMI